MSKLTLAIAMVVACLVGTYSETAAQGCVAVRPMGCSSSSHGGIDLLQKGEIQLALTYRHFKSFRHFRSDVEQHERLEENTEVINVMHSVDLALTYAISDRIGVNMNLPYISYDRSSLYEHYGNSEDQNPTHARFHTTAAGIGDMRFSGYFWLRNVTSPSNYSLGLGVKLPTGNPGVEDEFHRIADDGSDSTFVKPVDQSIQLGDGGVGFTVETQGFQKVFKNGYIYFEGFYLFNPEVTNDVLRTPGSNNINPITGYFSVADQFMGRFGISYILLPERGLSLGLGPRVEGIPAHDLIGSSNGYRRPGYSVMAEPTVSWIKGPFSAELNVPIALYRNRIKSVSDLSDPTGKAHGDAAFADYMTTLMLRYTFGKKDAPASVPPLVNPQ